MVGTGVLYFLPDNLNLNQLQSNSNFNLAHCFNSNDADSPYSDLHLCPYIENEEFFQNLGNDKLSFVSMNVRSISGKWNEICNFLCNGDNYNTVDFVTLQEIWNVPPDVTFTAEGYHPLIYKTRDKFGLSANIGGGGRNYD